jgi:hypothetical protein
MDSQGENNMDPSEAQIDQYSFHSDLYKETYGVRPRWMLPEDHTVEEWQVLIDRLLEEERENTRREQEAEAAHALWKAEVTEGSPLRVPMAAFLRV